MLYGHRERRPGLTAKEYIEAIAEELGRVRGRGLLLSPADVQLALCWHAAQVPLSSVVAEVRQVVMQLVAGFAVLALLAAGARIDWVPHGIDADVFSPGDPGSRRDGMVVITGNMYHPPNVEAVDFFCAGYGAYWPPEHFVDQKAVASIQGVATSSDLSFFAFLVYPCAFELALLLLGQCD